MITALALTALVLSDTSGAALVGSGKPKTEKRTVSDFSSVHALGSMTVTVLPGDKVAVEVTADDNLLAIVETSVKDKALTISTTKNFDKGTISVKVWAPLLDSFERDGSGNTSIKGVTSKALTVKTLGSGTLEWSGTADKVTVETLGSGAITLTGKAAALAARVAGSGGINASGLAVKTASAEIAGSANIDVNASDALQANVLGSGTVSYAGAPKVTKTVIGSGAVKGKDAPAKSSSGW